MPLYMDPPPQKKKKKKKFCDLNATPILEMT